MSPKSTRLVYWTTTTLIFLFEGVVPALTFNTDLAREGIAHLGYPAYFGTALAAFKVVGAVTLIVPAAPARVKEWAYAGFTFNFLFAAISHAAVDGFGGQTVFPLVALAVLAASYESYHRPRRPVAPDLRLATVTTASAPSR